MADREFPLPGDEQAARDRELIEAVERRETVGDRYARTAATPPRVGVRILQAGLVLLSIAVGYSLVSFWQVWSTGRSDEARAVDAIVVMGAAQYDGRPSPQLAARLDHAVDLWNGGLAPVVIVTGGNQEGDRFTEASTSAAYLVERGVPSSAIVQEDAGSTTHDSLDRARALVDESVETVLIVTDPYHALRSKLTAEEVGFTAYVSPAPGSVVVGAAELRRQLAESAGIAVGRIIGFERLSGLTD